ncbi:hypothetical protein ACSSS7_004665 [Eimeria intestinalis]
MGIEQIEHAQLAALLSLSLRCRLLQDGAWIHCGNGMQHMLDGRVLSVSPDEQKRAHVNCPAFSFGVRVTDVKRPRPAGPAEIRGQLRLLPLIFRVLPLRENEERGRCVFCLPRLASPAALESQASQPSATSPLRTKEDFQRFWWGGLQQQVRSMLAARALSYLGASEILMMKRLAVSWPAELQGAAGSGAASGPPQTSLPSACAIPPAGASLADLNPPKCHDSETGGPSRLLPPPALARRVQSEEGEPKEEAPKMSLKEVSPATGFAEEQQLQQQHLAVEEKAAESNDEKPQRPAVVVRLLPPPQLYAPERLAETRRLAQQQQQQQQQKQQQQQMQQQQQQQQRQQELQYKAVPNKSETCTSASDRPELSLPAGATAATPAVSPSEAATEAATEAAAEASVSAISESQKSGMREKAVCGNAQKSKKQSNLRPTKKAKIHEERRLREQQQEQELLQQQQPQQELLLQQQQVLLQQQDQQEEANMNGAPPAATERNPPSGSSQAWPGFERETTQNKKKGNKTKTTKTITTSTRGK